jgi:hypothetical protein
MDGVFNPTQPLASASPMERPANRQTAWPEFLLALAVTSIAVGIIWDISWHSTIGRDTFWTPAHMAIYFGGALGGFVGGWLAIKFTFLANPQEKTASVNVFGARAPLGAWVAIWGAVAMLTSAPFDNWWHNAYGLDVKIISPPHILLGFGMFGISVGAMLLAVAKQNRDPAGPGGGMFIYVGGIFLVLGAVLVSEYTYPNVQHTAAFLKACALMFPLRLVTMSRAGRVNWPATRVALVYLGVECLMIWILPLFPATPRLAPIFNPVTHMVPPAFPLLLVFPALGIDLWLRRAGEIISFPKTFVYAIGLGAIFLALFLAVQWYFAEFLLSRAADNWFFAGSRFWSYGARMGDWRRQFWYQTGSGGEADPVTLAALGRSWVFASGNAWLGLLWGNWMRKVVR